MIGGLIHNNRTGGKCYRKNKFLRPKHVTFLLKWLVDYNYAPYVHCRLFPITVRDSNMAPKNGKIKAFRNHNSIVFFTLISFMFLKIFKYSLLIELSDLAKSQYFPQVYLYRLRIKTESACYSSLMSACKYFF